MEIYNPSPTTIDLSGWRLSGAVDFVFDVGTSLASGEYLVIGENPTTLNTNYGIVALGTLLG